MRTSLFLFLALAVGVNAATIELDVGDSYQDSIDAHPGNTTFKILAGVHRGFQVTPKSGNTFVGEDGAVLDGSVILDSWSEEGQYWVHDGLTYEPSQHGSCRSEFPGCNYRHALYMNGEFVHRDTILDDVTEGRWYLDPDLDKGYLADDPTGDTVEIAVNTWAIGGNGTINNVTIRNLVMTKYATAAQDGAVRSRESSSGWVIEECEISYNHGGGISLVGNEHIVRSNDIHHNGQLGFGTCCDTNLVFEKNEIAFNNALGFNSGWEAGGTKFVKTHNAKIYSNWAHHNFQSPGLWSDIENGQIEYMGNLSEYNGTMGIFHEIGGTGEIYCNISRFNGIGWSGWAYGANILISHSSDVEIHRNVVEISAEGDLAWDPEPWGGHGINV
ncbi:MAG: hypothetical protein GF418_11975, partial [Chitinivibrionales bacterium]|nr:hypothetical protein [Chitinivibrionales bacterium]MBD3396335.1 hypothetical protein [Chitinivibrionales bacterium]